MARDHSTSTNPGVVPSSPDEEWQIGDWTFRPLLHRLSREEDQVRLEPKVSDLLLFLARHARQPVGKDAIFEGVWEQKFLGDSALTRTMAELRRALGDDARTPRYIETIPKIGYRLIADVRCVPVLQIQVSEGSGRESGEVSRTGVGTGLAGDVARGTVGAGGFIARFGPWLVAGILLVALASLVAVPTFRPTIGAAPEALTDAEAALDEPKLVAVLPLADMSHDPTKDAPAGQDFFAAGMTEALEATLAQAGTVGVISRHTVQRLLDGSSPLLERARGVGIDALVEGTVQRAGERVRITVRLTELTQATADRDTYSWVETYERDLRDVLALQEEISRAIADEVRQTLVRAPLAAASAGDTAPVDPEAYEVYLQARYVLNKRGPKWIKEASRLFDRAIEMSPDYAPAHSGKARVLARAAEFGGSVDDQWEGDLWEAALASANRSLELDPQSAEAHAVSATVEILSHWDWQAAERHLRQAQRNNPSDAFVLQRFAYFLTFLGRFDEAMEKVEKALKLDPLSPSSYRAASHVYFHAGRYDRVHQITQASLDVLGEDGHSAGGYSAWALAMEGRYEEALERLGPWIEKSSKLRSATTLAIYGWTLARAGRLDEARDIRQEMLDMPYEDSFGLAIVEAALGNHDEAFAAIDRALDERSRSIPYLKVEPFLRTLHGDPRFDQAVARLGL